MHRASRPSATPSGDCAAASARSASCARAPAQHVSFSSREGQEPLEPGMQDRLSWIAQLTARLDAPGLKPGGQILMPVAGTGGEVQHWVFTLIERDEAGRWHLRREPEGPFDTPPRSGRCRRRRTGRSGCA